MIAHTPEKIGYSAPSTVPIPNDAFSESCRQDLSSDTLYGTYILVDVEQSSFQNRSRGGGVLSCFTYYASRGTNKPTSK